MGDIIYDESIFPKGLDNVKHNKETKDKLKRLTHGSLLNLIVHGPESSGKYSLILAYLAEIYGFGVYKKDSIKLRINPNLEISIKSSNFHTEIDIARYYNHDKIIVGEYLKQRIKNHSIESFANEENSKNKERFHLMILLGCDFLSQNAQYAMRRLMETYYKTTRFIFITKNIQKICNPLQSRCISLSVKTPSSNEIYNILNEICFIKNIKITKDEIEYIINGSNCNLKIAIASIIIKNYSNVNYIDPELEEINTICKKVANFKGQISIIHEIKDNIYSLIIKGISSNKIINAIYNYFIVFFTNNKQYDNKKIDLIKIIAYYDNRIVNHCKDVIHLEAIFYNILSLMFNNKYNIDDRC
jgi:DNA polymerase III delta prime subunit